MNYSFQQFIKTFCFITTYLFYLLLAITKRLFEISGKSLATGTYNHKTHCLNTVAILVLQPFSPA